MEGYFLLPRKIFEESYFHRRKDVNTAMAYLYARLCIYANYSDTEELLTGQLKGSCKTLAEIAPYLPEHKILRTLKYLDKAGYINLKRINDWCNSGFIITLVYYDSNCIPGGLTTKTKEKVTPMTKRKKPPPATLEQEALLAASDCSSNKQQNGTCVTGGARDKRIKLLIKQFGAECVRDFYNDHFEKTGGKLRYHSLDQDIADITSWLNSAVDPFTAFEELE